MCFCCCNPFSCCCSMAKSCCKSLCDYCDVRGHLRQPWKCCSTFAIVCLIFSVIFIPTGLAIMGLYIDYVKSDRLGYRVLAWFGVASFIAGILLLSLGFLLCGWVWRVYHLREKTRIHLEKKQGTLYLGKSATSRFTPNSKESPLLTRDRIESKSKKQTVDVENLTVDDNVRLTKLQPRPVSVPAYPHSPDQKDPLSISPPASIPSPYSNSLVDTPHGKDTLNRPNSAYSNGVKETTLTRKSPGTFTSSLKRPGTHAEKTPLMENGAPAKPPRDAEPEEEN